LTGDLTQNVEKINVESKVAAYCHKQTRKDHCILVSVNNIDLFGSLTNGSNWPTHLYCKPFVVMKSPTHKKDNEDFMAEVL
jgi:hypothetical protein